MLCGGLSVAIVPQNIETFAPRRGSIPRAPPPRTKMKEKSGLTQWVLMITIFLIVINFAEIRETFRGDISFNEAESGEVVLYGTAWCGYCRKMRRFLNRHEIPFQDLDIEKSASAYSSFERIGGKGVPVVTVGTRAVHGYNISRLRKPLESIACSDKSVSPPISHYLIRE